MPGPATRYCAGGRVTVNARRRPRVGQPSRPAQGSGSRGPRCTKVSAMDLPARFNAASFFVDRHARRGTRWPAWLSGMRGARSPTRSSARDVDRAARVLGGLGVEPEHRVLLALNDSSGARRGLLGRDEAGSRGRSRQHVDGRRRLRLPPRRQPRAGRRGGGERVAAGAGRPRGVPFAASRGRGRASDRRRVGLGRPARARGSPR